MWMERPEWEVGREIKTQSGAVGEQGPREGETMTQEVGGTENWGAWRSETQREREVARDPERRVRSGKERHSQDPEYLPCPHLPALPGVPELLPLRGYKELLQGHEAVLVGVHLGRQVRVSNRAGPPSTPTPALTHGPGPSSHILHHVLPHAQPLLLHLPHVIFFILGVIHLLQLQGQAKSRMY